MVLNLYSRFVEMMVPFLLPSLMFISHGMAKSTPIVWSTEFEIDSPTCHENCSDSFEALRHELRPAIENRARAYCQGKNEVKVSGEFNSLSLNSERFVDGSPAKGRTTYIVNGNLICEFVSPKQDLCSAASPPVEFGSSEAPPRHKLIAGASGIESSDSLTSAKIRRGAPTILGALDKALIETVIKRNINQIRYCYQRELVKDPTLSGQIVVKFVISSQGDVTKTSIKSSSMDNFEVEACVAGRFNRFSFPEPKGGGIVIVSYPFLFSTE